MKEIRLIYRMRHWVSLTKLQLALSRGKSMLWKQCFSIITASAHNLHLFSTNNKLDNTYLLYVTTIDTVSPFFSFISVWISVHRIGNRDGFESDLLQCCSMCFAFDSPFIPGGLPTCRWLTRLAWRRRLQIIRLRTLSGVMRMSSTISLRQRISLGETSAMRPVS